MDLEKCARSQKKEQEGQGRFGRFGRVRAVLPHTGGPDGTLRLGGSISSGSLPVSAGHSVHTPPSPEGRMVSKSVSGCRKLQWRRKSVRSTAACRTRPRRASLLIVPSYLAQGANGCPAPRGSCPFCALLDPSRAAPLHFLHLCSGHSKLEAVRCIELPHALQRVLHSRAEWPVAPHMLHSVRTRAPLSCRCPDCAHSVR